MIRLARSLARPRFFTLRLHYYAYFGLRSARKPDRLYDDDAAGQVVSVTLAIYGAVLSVLSLFVLCIARLNTIQLVSF